MFAATGAFAVEPPPYPGIESWGFRRELALPERLKPVPTNDVTFARGKVDGYESYRIDVAADGKVTIRVEAETGVKDNAVLGKLLEVDGSLQVICDVKWTPTLAEAPKTIKTQEITGGVTAAEIDLGDAVLESASGFFSVEIRKK